MTDETINPSLEKSTTEAAIEGIDNSTTSMRGAVISEDEIQKLNTMSLKEIVLLFERLVNEGDIMEMNRQADYFKATFYKVLKDEKIASGFQSAEENGTMPAAEQESATEEMTSNPFVEIERAFKSIYSEYKSRRAAYFQNLEKERGANLETRNKIIDDLRELLGKTEDLKQTFPAFRELQSRWREAGPVSPASVKDVYETYQHLVEQFYDYVKLNNEFRDLDFKKNLEIKIALCEKAEALANETNIPKAFVALQKLHEEWKEYGPVAKEFREEIWDRFRAATSKINKMHQSYYEELKVNQKEALAAKTLLCEKAEELVKRFEENACEWGEAAKMITDLQKEWKTIGYASKKDNQRIYDRFRAACDKLYEHKREHYVSFKDQMAVNYTKKCQICEEAEALADSTDWKKTTEHLIDLQRQWKEIGPVPRKKSEAVWTRFRAACDKFFDNKEKSIGGANEEYVENMNAKKLLIDEIENYDGSADTRAAKEFFDRWNGIGFVPIKEKESLQKRFARAMAEKFPDFTLVQGRQGGGRRRNRVTENHSPVKSERDRLMQKYRKLESEIAVYENNLGFFASSKKADALIAEINKKIDAAKMELSELEAKINEIE